MKNQLIASSILAVASLAFAALSALAGPNAGGVLIVAVDTGFIYCEQESYCGSVEIQFCEEAVVETTGPETVLLNVIAAFPSLASPRVSAASFGWEYDNNDVVIVASGPCGDFELATANWPASGEGTAIAWNSTQTTTLVYVYWLAAYNYYGNPQLLALTGHPTQGAFFADDDVPSNLDPIVGLGAFGFDTEGVLPCFADGNGACCFEDCSCEVTIEEVCMDAGGEYMGTGTTCDPNPCPCPPPGACCLGTECSVLTEYECSDTGGEFLGDDTVCDPNPCTVVPTIERSWGAVKGTYR